MKRRTALLHRLAEADVTVRSASHHATGTRGWVGLPAIDLVLVG
ncbi:MAG: hypothetical protein OXC19_03730 [Bryobacterales bacterium]|nr:hypothetical protein [Bryobacterales bacterium]